MAGDMALVNSRSNLVSCEPNNPYPYLALGFKLGTKGEVSSSLLFLPDFCEKKQKLVGKAGLYLVEYLIASCRSFAMLD